MIFDFNKEEFVAKPNFKGGEKQYDVKMHDDGMNRIMNGKLKSGASIGYHTHEADSEIIFIVSGSGKVLFDDGEERVEAGQCHYCPKGHSHSLINDTSEDLIFYAVVPMQ